LQGQASGKKINNSQCPDNLTINVTHWLVGQGKSLKYIDFVQ